MSEILYFTDTSAVMALARRVRSTSPVDEIAAWYLDLRADGLSEQEANKEIQENIK